MGRTLSLTVVAQGVETKEQADFLRQQRLRSNSRASISTSPCRRDEIAELLRAQSATGRETPGAVGA